MSITELGAKVREEKIGQSLDSAIIQTTYNSNSIDVVVRFFAFGDYESGAMDGVFNAHCHLMRVLDNGGASAYPYADDVVKYDSVSKMWSSSLYRRFNNIKN